MSTDFFITFAPDSEADFIPVHCKKADNETDNYKNIPFSILHYLRNHETMKYVSDEDTLENIDDVIIVLKVNMLLLRAFDLDFFKAHNIRYSEPDNNDFPRRYNVNHGTPFAQYYPYLEGWREYQNIVKDASSVIYKMTESEASNYFKIGPVSL